MASSERPRKEIPLSACRNIFRNALSTEIVYAEGVLRLRIAKIRRSVLEHRQSALRVRLDRAIGNPRQTVGAYRNEGIRDRANFAPIEIVFVIAIDQLLEIFIGQNIVARNEVTARIHAAKLPARERRTALGRVSQCTHGGLRIPGLKIVNARAKRLLGACKILRRNLGRRRRYVVAVERVSAGNRHRKTEVNSRHRSDCRARDAGIICLVPTRAHSNPDD